MRRVCFLFVLLFALVASRAEAQQIPVPTGPVTFCGVQAQPAADSYLVTVDTAPAQPLTMDTPPNPACAAGETSFRLPANLFTLGQHTVTVTSRNAFGSTVGPVFRVTVGIAPGQFTITSVIPPSGE